MPSPSDDWASWRIHVLAELKRMDAEIRSQSERAWRVALALGAGMFALISKAVFDLITGG